MRMELKEIENTAVHLKALLAVLAHTDTTDLNYDLPYVFDHAADLADQLYCGVADMRQELEARENMLRLEVKV